MVVVIFVTAKDAQEANKIASKLVENELIACANVVSGVNSIFRWEGAVTQSEEVLMILKSHENHVNTIVKLVKEIHSYSVPEIIALPVVGGNPDYMDWVKGSVGL